ncbi:MAG: hypothetical protein FWC78_07290 [Defluviitaleaceae bacterium]|nr:hypothetical protein [Defluviitaleaceae bacterium]
MALWVRVDEAGFYHQINVIVAPPKNIRIERRKFPARRGAESRRALAVRKVFSDEGLLEIYKLYVRVFRWSDYKANPDSYQSEVAVVLDCTQPAIVYALTAP